MRGHWGAGGVPSRQEYTLEGSQVRHRALMDFHEAAFSYCRLKLHPQCEKTSAAKMIMVVMEGRGCKTRRDTGQNHTERLMKSPLELFFFIFFINLTFHPGTPSDETRMQLTD